MGCAKRELRWNEVYYQLAPGLGRFKSCTTMTRMHAMSIRVPLMKKSQRSAKNAARPTASCPKTGSVDLTFGNVSVLDRGGGRVRHQAQRRAL